jgi:hypothetical protein
MYRTRASQKLLGLVFCLSLMSTVACASTWYIPLREQVSGGFDHIQILMSYPYYLADPGIDPMFTVTPGGVYSPIGEQWSVIFIDTNDDFIAASGPSTGEDALYFAFWLAGTPSVDFPALSYQAYRNGLMVDKADITCWGPDETNWMVAPGTWTVRRPMPPYLSGDANRDGAVNVGDLGILAAHWQRAGMPWANADFTGEGAVNVGDLGVLAAHWGDDSFQYPAPGAPGQQVPEPIGMVWAAMAVAFLVRRARRGGT